MKSIVLLIALSASVSGFAQKKVENYTASNGITYYVGDAVNLGYGKGVNGRFLFLSLGGIFFDGSSKESMADRRYSKSAVTIKRMSNRKVNGADKMIFIVSGSGMFNYHLSIDEAIDIGEVVPGKNEHVAQFSVADEILKLKRLLDINAITQSEYDAQKKKLLDNN